MVRGIFLLSAAVAMAAIAPVAHAQSSLVMTAPETIVKSLYPRSELEKLIVLGTPESLAKAKEGLANSRLVPPDEKPALDEIIRGVSSILYGPSEIFSIGTDAKHFAKRDSVAIAQLIDASRGKIFAVPQGTDTSMLTELLPALAVFRTEDREIVRVANEYADRFESSGIAPSVIPDLVRAKTAKSAGDWAKAYVIYEKIANRHSDVWIARFELGCIAYRRGLYAEAEAYLSSVYPLRSQDPKFLAAYASALYQNARFADAEPIVRRALESDPGNPDLATALAHILIDRNAFQEAQTYVDTLGRKKPGDRSYLYLKTLQLKGLGRREEALRWARRAFQQYPRDAEFMVILAGLLFAGPKDGHREAVLLAQEAKRVIREGSAQADGLAAMRSPLSLALLSEADSEASRYLVVDAYNRQDWYAAATLLDSQERETMDKAMVATILRKSGRIGEALSYSSDWFSQNPESEAAAEAYLRTLAVASSGTAVASLGSGGISDIGGGLGILSLLTAGSSAAGSSSQSNLLGLVLKIISGGDMASYSSSLRSYILYLNGTIQKDRAAAIENYHKALFEEADNIEAILGLAVLYKESGDVSKAQFYLRQARMIGTNDKDLLKTMEELEKALASG